jgi:hypothetical protein
MPVNNNTPNSNVTGTGNGTPLSTPIPSPTREYTLQEVVGPGGLEAKLQESINNYVNPNNSPRPGGISAEETEAFKQAGDEITNSPKATISQLDSTLKEPAFSSHGVGLKEHQEHTKSLLDNVIKQKEADAEKAAIASNNAKKAEIDKQITELKIIQAKLKAVHEARLCLLNKHQNDEADTRKKNASKLLKSYWNLKPGNIVKGGPKGTTDLTIDDLFQQKGTTLTNGAGSEIRQLPDGSIEGNDPVAVGYATANTHKKCKFSGMPWDALKAAAAALDAGAEEVSFDEETLQNLRNPNLFNSFADYHQAQAEYNRIKELQDAHARVRNSKASNPVFDPKASQNKGLDNLHTLYCLGQPLDVNNKNQIQMLRGMEPIDVAQMAAAASQAEIDIISKLYEKALAEEFPSWGPLSDDPANRKKYYKEFTERLDQERQKPQPNNNSTGTSQGSSAVPNWMLPVSPSTSPKP